MAYALSMRWLLPLAMLGCWAGCSLEHAKAGERCERSTQCEPGLGCVSGRCSKDLSSIAATNVVPMLGGSAGAAGRSVAGGGSYDDDAVAGAGGN